MSSQKRGCLFGWLSILSNGKKTEGEGARQVALALPYRLRSDLLTKAELSFYHVLHLAVRDRFVINCKVGLNDLFYVARQKGSQAWMNKIDRKHVDFVLCDPTSMKPIAGIELDDSSHQREDRQERDAFVDRVFNAAGLPILHISVRRSYTVEEIRSEIYGVLGQKIPMTKSLFPSEAERILQAAVPMPVPEAPLRRPVSTSAPLPNPEPTPTAPAEAAPLRRSGATSHPSVEAPLEAPVKPPAAVPPAEQTAAAMAPPEAPLRRRSAAPAPILEEVSTTTAPVAAPALGAPLRRRSEPDSAPSAAPSAVQESPVITPAEATLLRRLAVAAAEREKGSPAGGEAAASTPAEALLQRRQSVTPLQRRLSVESLLQQEAPVVQGDAAVRTPAEALLRRRYAAVNEPTDQAPVQPDLAVSVSAEAAPPRRRLATQELFEKARPAAVRRPSPLPEAPAASEPAEQEPLGPTPSTVTSPESAGPRRSDTPFSPPRLQSEQPQAAPSCPKCGRPMSLMTVRRGPQKGDRLWGCLNYPSCQETMPAGD